MSLNIMHVRVYNVYLMTLYPVQKLRRSNNKVVGTLLLVRWEYLVRVYFKASGESVGNRHEHQPEFEPAAHEMQGECSKTIHLLGGTGR